MFKNKVIWGLSWNVSEYEYYFKILYYLMLYLFMFKFLLIDENNKILIKVRLRIIVV